MFSESDMTLEVSFDARKVEQNWTTTKQESDLVVNHEYDYRPNWTTLYVLLPIYHTHYNFPQKQKFHMKNCHSHKIVIFIIGKNMEKSL